MPLKGKMQAAVREIRAAVWAWVAVAMFLVSPTIGNLYYFAGSGERMIAIEIFAHSTLLLMMIYLIIASWRSPDYETRKIVADAIILVAIFLMMRSALSTGTYSDNLKSLIWVVKLITAGAVLAIFFSFGKPHLFERLTWAILVGLEGYSSIQYPVCKIAPGGSLDPSLWFRWGDPLAKSACSRAFGPAVAYADYVVCGILMAWVVWRWFNARSGKAHR